jgi:hypothetical protein
MLRETFLEHMEKGNDYVECEDHKTRGIYGSVSKWFPPVLKKCLHEYLTLPGASTRSAHLIHT